MSNMKHLIHVDQKYGEGASVFNQRQTDRQTDEKRDRPNSEYHSTGIDSTFGISINIENDQCL